MARRSVQRGSDAVAPADGPPGLCLDRRRFLEATGACAGLALLGGALRAVAADASPGGAAALPDDLVRTLEQSGLVYVSPLRSDGTESRCHGEVWFGWLDGAVVVITSREGWKGRALARGLDRARLWVGDHGRWKQLLGRNEAFRSAPHFDARAVAVRDAALLDRLLALYERKYPQEIGSWRDRMRAGFEDGSRVLIRYAPEGGAAAREPRT